MNAENNVFIKIESKMNVNIIELSRKSTGRTTRLADAAIQDFFKMDKGETMKIYDHEPTKEAQLELLNIIVNRLESEHSGTKFEANKIDRTITKL